MPVLVQLKNGASNKNVQSMVRRNLMISTLLRGTIDTHSIDSFSYPVYRSHLKICGNLYADWADLGRRRYKGAPPEGISVMVEFADNGLQLKKHNSEEQSSVLILPGAPGSHQDFSTLINHLTKLGVRCVALNFPDFEVTKQGKYFRHSPEEKADLVKTLLKDIGLNKFDLCVAHSSGVYPAVRLWKDIEGPEIRSFAWFNPVGHYSMKAIEPYWWFRLNVKAYQNVMGRALFEKIGPPILRLLGQPFMDNNKMDTTMLGAFTMYYSNYPKVRALNN